MAAVIRIEVTTSGGLESVKKDVTELGRTAEKEGGGGFNALQEIATGALRKIGEMVVNVGAAAFSKFGEVIGDSISAARESNQVAAQTAQVIKSTGSAAGVTADHVLDYASALSAASGKSLFGDEQIAQSTNLLLTFTNIKGKALDAATAISVDMAQALGGAPKDAAIALGKALNDPSKGITSLTRQGIVFDDEQKALIKTLQESGDMAGAQQIILNELNKEFGGSAAAAAAADGGFAQFKDQMGELEETIGKAILPVLGDLMHMVETNIVPIVNSAVDAFVSLTDTFTGFEGSTQNTITDLAAFVDYLMGFTDEAGGPLTAAITTVVGLFDQLSAQFEGFSGSTENVTTDVAAFVDSLMGWRDEAAGPFQSAIEGITNAFSTQLVPAFQTVWTVLQTQVWPILQDLATALFPLVGAAIQVLAGFWTDVLLPSIRMLWDLLTTVVLPILAALAGWLRDNLPGAIQATADFFTNTLFPILHQVYDWISANVIPILQLLAEWLITNVPVAIQAASDFFNTVLIPALMSVWNFIQTSIIPIFQNIYDWLFTTIPAATATTSNFWTGTLLPALNSVWTFINSYVIPLFTALVQVHMAALGLGVRVLTAIWNTELLPALTGIYNYVKAFLGPIIDWLTVTILTPLFKIMNDIEISIIGTLIPMFTKLSGLVKDEVAHAFNSLGGFASGAAEALHAIGNAVHDVIGYINDLVAKLNSVSVPSWLEGHSPPPMANWFTDIGHATRALNAQLPALQANLSAQIGPQGQSITNTANTRSFSYAPTIYTSGGADMPMDLALASSLAGV